VETLPLASVVPLTTDKAGTPLLFVTNAKVTGNPLALLPAPSVTVAVMMLCCPADRDVTLADTFIMYPAVDEEKLAFLVMMTAPYEPSLTLASTVS
jgi:hypothetical protein